MVYGDLYPLRNSRPLNVVTLAPSKLSIEAAATIVETSTGMTFPFIRVERGVVERLGVETVDHLHSFNDRRCCSSLALLCSLPSKHQGFVWNVASMVKLRQITTESIK